MFCRAVLRWVWASSAHHWSILDNEEKGATGLPEQPAAALLFQAPEFRPPTTQAKVEEAPEKRVSRPKEDTDRREPKEQPKRNEAKQKKPKKAQGGSDSAGQKPTAAAAGGSKQDSPSGKPPQKTTTRRRRRRPRTENTEPEASKKSDEDGDARQEDQVQGLKGSTRLEAKRMRRREGRRDSRRRHSITEAEFLARRESVERKMVVRHFDGSDQIAVLEDGILVEHFVARRTAQSIVGNVYLGKVQNVLPSMEAAFIDIGRGRNAVLYAGEVNWDAFGINGKQRRIETAMRPGDNVLVQVTKDPIGHKGARLTSQLTLAGRYLVFVPGSSMLGISRKLPEQERNRLKKLLRNLVPDTAGVIVRTAAEGATEEQLADDVKRLQSQWERIEKKSAAARKAPVLLRGEPELAVRVVRDQFNEDVKELVIQGDTTWQTVKEYVDELSPELSDRLYHWTKKEDVFAEMNVRQQLAKAMDKKVWLPSGGTLVIERTEALTVIDVNTGKFVGSGGTLEETVTRNNLEAAEEIVRQLRLRDIGGIIIIDFVDMVLESNRELVLRRLVESLGRDRTRHQVTEITSLGLVQMTRKRVGEGLVEAFSTTCEVCEGRGFIVHDHPVETHGIGSVAQGGQGGRPRQIEPEGPRSARYDTSGQDRAQGAPSAQQESHVGEEKVRTALNAIAAATVADLGDEEQETPEDAKTEERGKPKERRVLSVEDIQLPEKNEPAAEPSKPTRRRAVTTGRVDPSRGKAGVVVKLPEVGGGTLTVDLKGREPKKGRNESRKDEEAKRADKDSAAEAVRSLLQSE